MLLFNKTILSFIAKSESLLKEVLREAGFNVRRSRFEYKNYYYPISIVIFEGSELGRFNPSYMQIELNQRLMWQAKDEVIKSILRHEFAHFITHIDHGEVSPHGPEFKSVCQRLGFDPQVSKSTMNLQEENLQSLHSPDVEKLITRVKKLLQLSESENSHEAELATIKANEILLKYNIQNIDWDEDSVYLERVLSRPRKDAKLTSIYEILKHFIVKPVISSGVGTCSIEVTGSYANVKLASYVAGFLDRELDVLWSKAKIESAISGLRARNSFYMGIAKGFDEKMKALKNKMDEIEKQSLVILESRLDQKVEMIYRRLSSSYSQGRTDFAAHTLGQQKGRNLNIRSGVEAPTQSGRLLKGTHHA